MRVKVVKNKVAPPFRQAEFDIMYNTGISREGGILDLGVKFDIINKAGTWYSYNEERVGQGRENVKRFLQDNPKIALDIENKIKVAAGLVGSNTKAKKEEEPKKVTEVNKVAEA